MVKTITSFEPVVQNQSMVFPASALGAELSVDYKSFFKTLLDKIDRITYEMVTPGVPLVIEEYGIYITDDKKKISAETLFAVTQATSKIQNTFTMLMSMFTQQGDLMDQANKLVG